MDARVKAESPQFSLIQVKYANESSLANASWLDIWQVDQINHTFLASVTADQLTWLKSNGFNLQAPQNPPKLPTGPSLDDCYRPIAVLNTDLASRAQAYPDLVELMNIGSSYEGQDLTVARITNHHILGIKPRFFLMANIHGREVITPEVAFAFLDTLLNGYGRNPLVTALVDWQEIYVLLSANPDGHIKTEQYANIDGWRKNTQPYGQCLSYTYGVDLNRNFSFNWGVGPGSSSFPCDITYRGPGAASEPETQAIQNFVRSIFPDQRGNLDSDPAPNTASGILVTLHSYGNLILWPWGTTGSPAPNSAQLSSLGQKMSETNLYTPIQSYQLYPTNGTTDDWAYGELGLASFTFEIGDDGFFPACSRYNSLVQPNVSALLLAARSAFLPYQTGSGPEITNVQVVTSTIKVSDQISVTASAQAWIGSVNAVTAYIDLPPWVNHNPLNLTAQDGHFNQTFETAHLVLQASKFQAGRHLLWIMAQADNGDWGSLNASFIDLPSTRHLLFLPLMNSSTIQH